MKTESVKQNSFVQIPIRMLKGVPEAHETKLLKCQRQYEDLFLHDNYDQII